jgi:NAD(P)H-quinone oxidoreductase subunit 5
MYVGWEVIGLTSALLISFFHERGATRENALRAFWAYRLSDTSLLLAGLLIGFGASSHGASHLSPQIGGTANDIVVPLLILLAALPKSAQVPFSAWLPRAMEGPTPSSAIFYGGLSVHAGLYLLLRSRQLMVLPDWLLIPIFVLGAASAIIGTMQASVQTDIKGSLAFASMAQVGLMFVELALGFHQLVILHFIGHSAVRTYQILSANSSLHEGRLRRRSRSVKVSSVKGKFYQIAFLTSLRDGTGAHSLVTSLERISLFLGEIESIFTANLTRVVSKIFGRKRSF